MVLLDLLVLHYHYSDFCYWVCDMCFIRTLLSLLSRSCTVAQLSWSSSLPLNNSSCICAALRLSVVDRARNVELIESRPELPRQMYQHSSRRNTSWNKSVSLDHCNSLHTATAGQHTAKHAPSQYISTGSLSNQYSQPPPGGSVTSTHFQTPSSMLHSQTSSKNSASSEDLRRSRAVASYRTSQSSVGGSSAGSVNWTDCISAEHSRSEHRAVPQCHNSTRTMSHRSSSTDQQLLPVHHGQLIDWFIDWFIGQFLRWLIDSFIHSFISSFIDWLIHWLIYCSIPRWLIDSLISLSVYHCSLTVNSIK